MTRKKYIFGKKQIEKYGISLCLEIYEKYDNQCHFCGGTNLLNIHHLDLSGGTDSPNNSINNLQLLCQGCHNRMHTNIRWGNADIFHKWDDKIGKKKYYDSHKEQWKVYSQNRDKEKIKENKRKYYLAHKEEMNLRSRQYYQEHKSSGSAK